MTTIKITVPEMIDNWVDIAADRMRVNAKNGMSLQDSLYAEIRTGLEWLAKADMPGIRRLFKQGNAPLLVGDAMCVIDDARVKKEEVEIRVYHNDKLIGVIIDSEIVV